MEPARFTRKPQEVTALQWHGTNHAEMEAFLGTKFGCDPAAAPNDEDAACIRTTEHNSWEPIWWESWAVRTDDGYVSILASDEFDATYAAAVPSGTEEASER